MEIGQSSKLKKHRVTGCHTIKWKSRLVAYDSVPCKNNRQVAAAFYPLDSETLKMQTPHHAKVSLMSCELDRLCTVSDSVKAAKMIY